MFSTTQTFIALFAIASFASFTSIAQASNDEPHCFHLGAKLFGKNLDVPCVHHTDDFSVSFDVVSGSVEMVTSPTSEANLELYSGARVLTPWEDCCPPPSFVRELACPRIEESGECCYTETNVHVTGLPEQSGCVHSVEDYASYVPTGTSRTWNTSNPEANHEVEVYAALHPNGCCECFMYSIPCSPCAL